MFQGKAEGEDVEPARDASAGVRFQVDAALGVLATDLRLGGVEAILPAPQHVGSPIPPRILAEAYELLKSGQRLDMRSLAVALGIGRTSLYRKVGGREPLLAAGFWHFLRRSLSVALGTTAATAGIDRVADTVAVYLDDVAGQPWLAAFLKREPQCGLRILLDRGAAPQLGLGRAFYTLMEAELQRGNLDRAIRPDLLAYPLVRICDSYLYADIINGQGPDLDAAVFAVRALLHGQNRPLWVPWLAEQSGHRTPGSA